MDGIRRLANFLFFSLIAFGVWGAQKNPTPVLILSIALILLGVPLFIYGFINIERYKDVFDYEPAIFWGKMRNGKEAREVLGTINVIGLWGFLAGAVLLLTVFFL